MKKTNYPILLDDIPLWEWNAFLDQHPSAKIFHTPQFFQLYQAVPGYEPHILGLFNPAGELIAVLPFAIIQSEGWFSTFTRRSIIEGGPLALENNARWLALLLEAYFRFMQKKKALFSLVRHLSGQYPHYAALRTAGFQEIEHFNFVIDTSKPLEELNQLLHPKRRANIRRAEKKQVRIREALATELAAVYELIKKTYSRVNIPRPPAALFLQLYQQLPQHCRILVAEHEEKLIGCRVYLLYRGCLYDWYAGSDLQHSGLHANDLLPWAGIRLAKQLGLTQYDFCGSGQAGVRNYKRRFGGQLVQSNRLLFVHQQLRYTVSKWAFALYRKLKFK